MDTHFFTTALNLAKQRKGFTAPNPAVGAVIVKNGVVIGGGSHWGPGQPHAEINALAQAGEQAREADVYVTLEPCCHHGRTPPCTDALIKAGVKRVFFAQRDPNPQVDSGGQKALVAAGIPCEAVEIPAITEFYRSYCYAWRHQRPWLIGKIAQSLDGVIATANGEPLPLTGAEAREFTHQQRLQADAILTSGATLRQDDPQMNVRLGDDVIAKPVVIVTTGASISLQSRVFSTAAAVHIIHGENAAGATIAALQAQGAHCYACATDANGMLDLHAVLQQLGQLGFHQVWLEAGGRLLTQCLQQHLLNELYIYIAMRVIGQAGLPAFTQAIDFAKSVQPQWLPLGADVAAHYQLTES